MKGMMRDLTRTFRMSANLTVAVWIWGILVMM